MEILIGLAGLAGLALLLQSKSPLPSEADLKKAQAKLGTDPSDPDANTVVGKYLAFVQGDYQQGLPFLAKSGDATLRTLAEHELAPLYADTAPKKIGMGDEWVAAAKNYKPIYRTFYDRAAQWYAAAWPDLDGIWKDKLRERLKKLLQVTTPGGAVKKVVPAGWTTLSPTNKVSTDSTIAHVGGKSIRIDMARDKPAQSFWFQSPLFVAPKGQVTFSAYVASDGTEAANDRLILNWYNQAGEHIGRAEPFVPVDSPWWHKVEVTVDVPKDAARFNVAILLFSANGTLWVDDFSVKSNGKELVDNGSFEK